ncbi:hypothetical protein [Sediminibacterium soli]|uniref:hypothetical protein n=1 Tax=Sediminibacterium soli TaxID=2698829 RepID=UPI00137A2FCC|nr:hypothetical protein [Sediminibacterium soli]NCI48248.1 hypothetical protein [Sediminibacterium soli]
MLTRKTRALAALIALSAVLFSFRIAQADFSGTWSLNESKSELGQFGGRMADSKISIEQKEGILTVTRTRAGMGGQEVTTKETLTEGKESEVAINASIKKKSTLKWAADGQSFTLSYVISGDFNGNAFEWKGTETWAIAADGKTFSLTGTLNTPQGEVTTKAAYDKK